MGLKLHNVENSVLVSAMLGGLLQGLTGQGSCGSLIYRSMCHLISF